MINKRLKSLIIKYSLFILCITLVSCANLNNSTYINKSLLEANTYIKNSKFEKAIEVYDKILLKQPLNQKALFNKAVLLRNSNNNEDALEILSLLIETYPNNIKPYQLKIEILRDMDNSDKVIKTYNSLFSLTPYLYTYRAQYLEYLISIYKIEEKSIYNEIKENSLFLLSQNQETNTALKALCTIEKNNAEYSALLFLENEKSWNEIYSDSLEN